MLSLIRDRTPQKVQAKKFFSLVIAIGATAVLFTGLLLAQHSSNIPRTPGAGPAKAARAVKSHFITPAGDVRFKSSSRPRPGQIMKPLRVASSAAWSVTYPVTLPAGYQSPTGIAAAANGSDLWLFAQGGSSSAPLDTLFYWTSRTNSLTAYQLDTANESLQAGLYTPIVVDSSGNAWLGDNRTLVYVDRGTGEVTTLTLPDVATASTSSDLPVPPTIGQAEDYTSIDALAVAPDGSIVVARQYATALQLVNTSTEAVTGLSLPAGTELASLGEGDIAGAGTGEIAAALYAGSGVHELGQYSSASGWTLSTSPCPAYAVSMTGDVLGVTGPNCAAFGTDNSAVAPTLESQETTMVTGSEHYACAVYLGQDRVALCGSNVIGMSTLGGASTTSVALGEIAQAPPSYPNASQQVTGPTSSPIAPGLIATSGDGSLWFVPEQGSQAVGRITSS